MTDTPQTDRTIRRVGRRLRKLETTQARAARASQAGQRSVEDGDSIPFYDEDGNIRITVGSQPDGSFTTTDTGGEPLNAPSTPLIAVQYEAVTITWDGFDEFGEQGWRADFARVEVHASTVPGFTPDDETQIGSFESRYGGNMSFKLATGVTLAVLFVAVNTSGVESAASAEVEAVSTNQLTEPDVAGGTVTGALIRTAATGDRIELFGAPGVDPSIELIRGTQYGFIGPGETPLGNGLGITYGDSSRTSGFFIGDGKIETKGTLISQDTFKSGIASVTIAALNTVTSVVVPFSTAYPAASSMPNVTLTVQDNNPQQLSVGVASVSRSGFIIRLVRTAGATGAVSVQWTAIST